MDKKLLALFRKLFALDDKALPDSISPDDFGKLIEKSAGKLFIKPEDFKKLQKTLSQKDVDFKRVEEEFKKLKATGDDKKSDTDKELAKMGETIKTLTDTIGKMNVSQESERLAKEYPDILPELLVGKDKDQIEKIVDNQRALNKKLYGDSQHFAPPDYSTEAEVDEEIEKVKADKESGSEVNAAKILNLERQKEGLSNENENA